MYENDLDMYGVPYPDGDPLTGLIVTIALIILWYLAIFIYYKLKEK
mgnify:CR=1 FL=1|tara:strand:+ start:450 stop:587 length:138 start_codon:yes stop_codon:yes gene_type:complete